MTTEAPTERLRVQLAQELGLSLHAAGSPESEPTDREWELLNRAIDLVISHKRVELEVGMHVNRLLPCDALAHSGIVSSSQLAAQIAEGRFDGQLCALPLSAI